MTNVFEAIEKLTKKEQAALYELKMACGFKKDSEKSIWELAVINTCNKGCPATFRQLICELKSQAHDQKDVMQKILGSAYESVMAL